MKTLRKKPGFTLIELMLVLSIIIILGAAVTVGIATYLRGGRMAQTRSSMAVITSAIGRYRYVHNAMPASLIALTEAQANGSNGQLLTTEDLQDAWGHTFYYGLNNEKTKYALWSTGPDGISNSGSTGVPDKFSGDDIGLSLNI